MQFEGDSVFIHSSGPTISPPLRRCFPLANHPPSTRSSRDIDPRGLSHPRSNRRRKISHSRCRAVPLRWDRAYLLESIAQILASISCSSLFYRLLAGSRHCCLFILSPRRILFRNQTQLTAARHRFLVLFACVTHTSRC